jgi:hypothetical protein
MVCLVRPIDAPSCMANVRFRQTDDLPCPAAARFCAAPDLSSAAGVLSCMRNTPFN